MSSIQESGAPMSEGTNRRIAWDQLRFDLHNVRLPVDSIDQHDAMRHLLEKNGQEILNLAESIYTQETASPVDHLIVIEHGDELVVLDGNRRLAAVNFLLGHEVLNEFAKLKSSRDNLLSKPGKVPEFAYCWLAPDRDSANFWIEIRHNGQQDGRGMVSWDSSSKDRHLARLGKVSTPQGALLNWLEDALENDEEMLLLIEKVRETQFTTLQRLMTAQLKEKLGIRWDKKHGLETSFSAQEVRDVWYTILSSLSTGRQPNGTLWSRAKAEDVNAFLSLHASLIPDPNQNQDVLPAPKPAPGKKTEVSRTKPKSNSSNQSAGPMPSSPSPVKPSSKLFVGIKFRPFDPRIHDLYKQVVQLSIDEFPDVCAVMLRVLVDLCTSDFLRRHSKDPNKQSKLADRICTAMRILDPDIGNQKSRHPLRQLYASIQTDRSGTLIESIHGYVHNSTYAAAPSDIKALQNNFVPYLDALSKNLSQ